MTPQNVHSLTALEIVRAVFIVKFPEVESFFDCLMKPRNPSIFLFKLMLKVFIWNRVFLRFIILISPFNILISYRNVSLLTTLRLSSAVIFFFGLIFTETECFTILASVTCCGSHFSLNYNKLFLF